MTYQELLDLKYNKGLSTYELVRLFPHDLRRVSEVALLDVPEETLEELLQEKNILRRLKYLKRRFLGERR